MRTEVITNLEAEVESTANWHEAAVAREEAAELNYAEAKKSGNNSLIEKARLAHEEAYFNYENAYDAHVDAMMRLAFERESFTGVRFAA
ncbi:hypothetical protein Lsed01_00831 [Demequina sediminis]|uniref:Uncharacterized protein n=1 Tax=Demequina sediminis TaxID=1930058 RepID=A0ABP9WFE2_9MICO|nr:hypothetical protein [Demequina sediminis]BDZ62515.1 hypothetical protein GCM10025873_23060 [Demequina sediminis]